MSDDDGNTNTPQPSPSPLGKGIGRVAKYIRMFGNLGKQIQPYDGLDTPASYKEERTQFHDWPEKYPQSCVSWQPYTISGLKIMFHYLREREYWTMREIADGEDRRQALEEIQAMLIFMAHNIKEYNK